ncbi:hypothetical protein LUZ60_008923 [Juncus effusus]|nr:hypothetical protein LUZ60_008923 [Juncus effusus]
MEKTQKKTVVIVGGGIAGALLAKTLQFDANVVLIDSKEYYEIPWSELRSKVEPKFAEKTLIKHTEYFTQGTLVIARATGITQTVVITDNGREMSYDYLVIATGHVGEEIKQGYLAQNHAKIVTKNMTVLMKGGKESSLASYKAGPAMAIVSLGRKNAVAQFPFMTISGRMAGMIKSKDLFVGMTRKVMGVDQ